MQGLDAGADDYLIKPFTARELLARVAAHLSMHRRRQEAEKALRESQAMLERSNEELRRANADLEQFSYAASHDLQEPLRQIAVYSQLLQTRFASKHEGKGSQYLGYCIDGAHRMEMLISGLLAYSQVSRTSDSASGTVNIGEVIETVRKTWQPPLRKPGPKSSRPICPPYRATPSRWCICFKIWSRML